MAEAVDRVAIERVFRADYGRAVATLTRLLGDLGLAEEAVQDALLAALESWPRTGVPPSVFPAVSSAGPARWPIGTTRY